MAGLTYASWPVTSWSWTSRRSATGIDRVLISVFRRHSFFQTKPPPNLFFATKTDEGRVKWDHNSNKLRCDDLLSRCQWYNWFAFMAVAWWLEWLARSQHSEFDSRLARNFVRSLRLANMFKHSSVFGMFRPGDEPWTSRFESLSLPGAFWIWLTQQTLQGGIFIG